MDNAVPVAIGRPVPARGFSPPRHALFVAIMFELKHELAPPFEMLEPAQWRGAVLFNSPHSGSVYPRAFLAASRLDVSTLRRSEDCFVDELALGVVGRGFPLLRAHFPRCYVDV